MLKDADGCEDETIDDTVLILRNKLMLLLETCFEQFVDWLDMEPEEIDSDRPTDEEMKHYEEAEKHHHQLFQALEHQASCFWTSIGRRKLSDKKTCSSTSWICV